MQLQDDRLYTRRESYFISTLILSPVRHETCTSEWLGRREPVTMSSPTKHADGSAPTQGKKKNIYDSNRKKNKTNTYSQLRASIFPKIHSTSLWRIISRFVRTITQNGALFFIIAWKRGEWVTFSRMSLVTDNFNFLWAHCQHFGTNVSLPAGKYEALRNASRQEVCKVSDTNY